MPVVVSVRCPICRGKGRTYCHVSHGDPWEGINACDCGAGPCQGCDQTGSISLAVLNEFNKLVEADRKRYDQEESRRKIFLALRNECELGRSAWEEKQQQRKTLTPPWPAALLRLVGTAYALIGCLWWPFNSLATDMRNSGAIGVGLVAMYKDGVMARYSATLDLATGFGVFFICSLVCFLMAWWVGMALSEQREVLKKRWDRITPPPSTVPQPKPLLPWTDLLGQAERHVF